jgi:hypothetical protein
MRPRGGAWRRREQGRRGSILIEVVVAAALVGLIVVPLAGSLSAAVDRARAERARVDSGPDTSSAWEWGRRVVAAWWTPGPALHVRVSADGAAGVGLWVDGWLVDEVDVATGAGAGAGAGEVTVDAGTWSGLSGRELVVRARDEAGAWGPPWRLAVAAGGGGGPDPGQVGAALGAGTVAAVHRGGVGSTSLDCSWTAASLVAPAFPSLFVLGDEGVRGWAGVTLDDKGQWWRAEEGRSVDLYY